MASTTAEEKKKTPFTIPDVGKIDLNKLTPKNNEPEYIPFNTRGRDFFGRVSFNTGVMWLGGFIAGGSYGIVEGWRGAANPNLKIRFNSVMNGMTRRGNMVGNALGIIGFLHTSSVWAADFVEIDRLTGIDAATPVFAGILTGGVYKSTRGPRAAALAATIGAVASTAYWYGGTFINDTLLGRGGKF